MLRLAPEPSRLEVKREGSGLRLAPENGLASTLDRLLPEGRLGLAVSGGPDSLALLLLAAAARPRGVEAATVDHRLREGSAGEAAMVAEVCATLDVLHETLTVDVSRGSSLQAQARVARYAALGAWAERRGLAAVATAHHADDQAETLLMRLARGSGLGGLAGVRETRALMSTVRLIRPLLGASKAELEAVVRGAGLRPVDDPSNSDRRHDRTQARALMASADWLSPERLARSASALGEAEEALAYAAARLASERLKEDGAAIRLTVTDLPRELQRRLIVAALTRLDAGEVRGPEVDRALAALKAGGTCTLGGVKLEGGAMWRLSPAPPRRS